MRNLKRIMSLLFVAMLVVMMFPFHAAAANEDKIVVYAQMPDDWSAPSVWAWADDGTNAFAAWPGGEMDADAANPGWYYCYIPNNTVNIIVNANDGTVQTAGEIKLESKNAWLTIKEPEDAAVSYEQLTNGEIPAFVEKFTVHAQLPTTWTDANIWAWSDPDGKNAFEAWPGKTMKADANNEGWYTANVPTWCNSIIVSTKGGEVKTEDIKEIDPAEMWITIAEEGKAEFSYDDPAKANIPNIKVHVQTPADWANPNLWAWSAPDGTNVYAAWPGEALEMGENGWLVKEVPGWVNSLIVNASEGGVQTNDVSIETGKDVWLTVTGPDSVAIAYEEPAAAATTPAPTETAPAPTATPTATPAPAAANNTSTIIIIVAVIAVLVIAVAVIMIQRKKKNSK